MKNPYSDQMVAVSYPKEKEKSLSEKGKSLEQEGGIGPASQNHPVLPHRSL